MQNILLVHDGSKSADKALKKTVEIAVCYHAAVTVMSVVPELYLTQITEAERNRIADALSDDTKNALERIRKTLTGNKRLSDKSIDVKTMMRQGDPAEKILETAKKMKIDLVVTGSHGKHGARKFLLGSVASKIVENAKCSVLVVK